jgi:hypothetical protein
MWGERLTPDIPGFQAQLQSLLTECIENYPTEESTGESPRAARYKSGDYLILLRADFNVLGSYPEIKRPADMPRLDTTNSNQMIRGPY